MKLFFTLLVTIISLSSCNYVVKKAYGIKKPRIESEASMKKAAMKFGMDTTNIWTNASGDFFKNLNGKGLPDIDVFDANGNYIEYRDTDTSCNAGLFGFIPDLDPTKTYRKTGLKKLNEETEKYRDVKGNKVKVKDGADFYLLVYWASWTGKLNKDHVAEWEALAKANKSSKIEFIKVNMDMQSYWSEEEQQSISKVMRNQNKN